MQQLPQHRAFTLSEFGIRFHKFTPSQDNDAPKHILIKMTIISLG